jgi:hypothetical protein
MRIILTILLFTGLSACAQVGVNVQNDSVAATNPNQILKSLPLTYTTQAYRDEVLRLMLKEANEVAGKLRLNDSMPIISSNLVEKHITPPRMAKIGVGSITTSNYVYYFSVGDKFSSIVRTDSNKNRNEIKAKYLWPIDRMDTNAAYQTATQWLKSVSIDVEALNRDCDTVVRAWTPEGVNGKHFVPQYSIYWVIKGTKDSGSVAEVEFLEPTKSLIQLYVENSQYILRQPLQVTNLASLLNTNNAVK